MSSIDANSGVISGMNAKAENSLPSSLVGLNNVVISGLKIKAEVRDTFTVRGKGLFALEDIAAGRCIWQPVFHNNVRVFGKEESRAFMDDPGVPEEEKLDFMRKAYGDFCIPRDVGIDVKNPELGAVYWPLDESQFVNHASGDNANIGDIMMRPGSAASGDTAALESFGTFALRDIHAGSELCEDYSTWYCPPWYLSILKKHGEVPDYYDIEASITNKRFPQQQQQRKFDEDEEHEIEQKEEEGKDRPYSEDSESASPISSDSHQSDNVLPSSGEQQQQQQQQEEEEEAMENTAVAVLTMMRCNNIEDEAIGLPPKRCL
jgi:hypothetical protein